MWFLKKLFLESIIIACQKELRSMGHVFLENTDDNIYSIKTKKKVAN